MQQFFFTLEILVCLYFENKRILSYETCLDNATLDHKNTYPEFLVFPLKKIKFITYDFLLFQIGLTGVPLSP